MADIRLNWDDNAPAEYVDHYNVYGMKDGQAPLTLVGTTPVSEIELTGLDQGVWTFQVEAVNLAGNSPWSQPIQGPGTPSAPTGLTLDVV